MKVKKKVIEAVFSRDTHVEIYLKTVEENLFCAPKVRKQFMKLLRADMVDFLEHNPNSSMTDICKRFVDPYDRSDETLLEMERIYFRKIKRNMVISVILVAILSVLLVVALVFVQRYFNATAPRIVNSECYEVDIVDS